PADSDGFTDRSDDHGDSLSVEDLAAFNDASDDDTTLDWESDDASDDGIIEFNLPEADAPQTDAPAQPLDTDAS
ncbi:hypothetical protein, partial [Alcanivorax sp. HI0007]